MAVLVDTPNPHGPHFYATRVRPILAILEHITASLEDLDATDDNSAEATARYAATTDRRVSWHQGTDSDSNVVLLPDDHTAFHVRGYNSCTLGRELSKRNTDWRKVPAVWRDRTLGNAARADAQWVIAHNIPIRKATKAELDEAIAHYDRTGSAEPVGFLGHWELDPGRRSDPGLVGGVDTFPWEDYLALVRHLVNASTAPPTEEEDDDMPCPEQIEAARIDLVNQLFATYLGRKPTVSDMRHYVAQLRAKGTEAIERDIANSDEAKKRDNSPVG